MSEETSRSSRVAVVTGGSGGIGREVAARLAAAGTSVIVNYAGNAERAKDVVEEITAAGGTAAAIGADVADEQAVVHLFEEAERLFGGVDVVVHAAARMDLAPLVDFDLATLDEMLRINIRGTFVIDQQAARKIRGGGSILNFSSSVLGRMLPNYTGYAASKGAVEAMTFILASELRGRDINVNAIAPGPTATPMFSRVRTTRPSPISLMPRLSTDWEPQPTSPTSSCSSPAPPVTGSTGKQSEPMAA
jgi:3-oxoacyl-[acyl-carrier protein] reductase